jgi:hypothetical protein
MPYCVQDKFGIIMWSTLKIVGNYESAIVGVTI